MFAEFRKFIAKGNVIDLAVAVILGAAFTAIVTSLTNDIIMPLIGVILGGVDFANLSVQVGEATVAYGLFIQAIINFVLIALATGCRSGRRKRRPLRPRLSPPMKSNCFQRFAIC